MVDDERHGPLPPASSTSSTGLPALARYAASSRQLMVDTPTPSPAVDPRSPATTCRRSSDWAWISGGASPGHGRIAVNDGLPGQHERGLLTVSTRAVRSRPPRREPSRTPRSSGRPARRPPRPGRRDASHARTRAPRWRLARPRCRTSRARPSVSSQPRAVLADTSGEDKAVCAAQHGEVQPRCTCAAGGNRPGNARKVDPASASSTTPWALVLAESGSIH